MRIILILVLASLRVCAVWSQDNETLERTLDALMQNAGYPAPGDIPTLNRKIFRGQRVHIREYPFVASVRRMTSHYLTAALLTKNTLVTVAHPLLNVPVMELNVVLGENYCDRGATTYAIVLVIIHEAFDPFTLKNDLAMLRLYEDISYKGNMKPIPLAPPHDTLAGEKAFVAGWGRCDNTGTELCLDRSSKYYPDEKLDPMLRFVTFTMHVPYYYCEGYRRNEIAIHPGMLCVGVAREEDPVAPCLGVPGALLVTNARLVGILSWGFGCGYSYDLPLVYTSTLYYSNWIAYNIRESRTIKPENLSALFEATKAAVLAQWLIETRVITPKLVIRNDKTLEPLDIDYEIAKLRGTTYDVRDFISNGKFHVEKLAMYAIIRNQITRAKASVHVPKLLPVPFLKEETLNESGIYESDIITTTTVTTAHPSADADEDGVEIEDDDDEN